MPDTLVEPVPPTIRDEGVPPPPRGPAPRDARGGRVVALVFLALLVVSLGGVVGFYFFVWHYQPVARRHIPGNANVAARLDLAQVVLFRPVRDRLWPLAVGPREPALGAGKPFSERLRDETGLDLRTDVREIVLASVEGKSWVALVGGRIPRGRFVKGLERVLRDGGGPAWRLDRDVLVGPLGTAIAQADDGTIVLGTDRAVVDAALPASDDWTRLGLPAGAAITFASTKDAWLAISAQLAPIPSAGALAKIEHATGRMALGDAPEIELELRVSGDPEPIAKDLESLLAALRIAALVGSDVAGERQALQSATVSVKPGAVVVSAPWPYESLDRACERLAQAVSAGRPFAWDAAPSALPAAPSARPAIPSAPAVPSTLPAARDVAPPASSSAAPR